MADSATLLYHLAAEYNNTIFTASTSYVPREINIAEELGIIVSTERDELDDMNARLEMIEDEMMIFMSAGNLSAGKRRLESAINPRNRKRGKYDTRKLMFTNPSTMEREEYTFMHSVWYCSYISDPRPGNKKWEKMFRDRFRLPYNSFLDFVKVCEQSEHFKKWSSESGINRYNKRKVTPIILLILCALRYLGRSVTLDDLEEYCAINRQTIREFIHLFFEFGSSTLYNRYVKCPQNATEMKDCGDEYSKAGFPRCIGSTDATHIVMENCSYRLRQLHLGFKLSHTARTYNMTVNHRRKILSTTTGHPAQFNDKTLVLYDDFVNRLNDGKYNNINEFTLMAFGPTGEIINEKYKGAYVIVDNGYLKWSTTIPPMKTSSKWSEIRFSQWLESLRKDVECAFGILKSRWRILKTGIRVHGIDKCDKVWLTCCALHNMLLEIDGLCSNWTEGVPCYYTNDNFDDYDELPFSVQRLINPATQRIGDLSGMKYGNDCNVERNNTDNNDNEDTENIVLADEDGYIKLQDLTMDQFRKRLIIHFNIAFSKKKLVWPTRNK